jgi:hypothetical protein
MYLKKIRKQGVELSGVGDDSEYDTPSFLRSRDKEKNDFSKND